jgi:TPR repeat protein
MWERGELGRKNHSKSLRYFEAAAKRGHNDAAINAAALLSRNSTDQQSIIRWYAWLNVASSRGSEEAARRKIEARDRMRALDIAETQAISQSLETRKLKRLIPDFIQKQLLIASPQKQR